MSGDNWPQDIAELLGRCRTGFLATQGRDGPESSMAPYALHDGGILLHLSNLARHTSNITAHATAGLMICTPETAMDSPLALPRLSLQGCVTPVSSGEVKAARQAYLHAIRDAEPLFGFADFRLYRLDPDRIHWVGGFGRACDIPQSAWKKVCANIATTQA